MKKKLSLETLWRITRLLGLLLFAVNLSACARNSVILSESETVYVIKQGTVFRAEFDGKEQDWIAERDKVVLDKGRLLELEIEANRCAGQ